MWSSISSTASSQAARTRRPFAVSVAGRCRLWFGCRSRLINPFLCRASMTSLIAWGVMYARRASCAFESGFPCRWSTLKVVYWSVVRPYGATRSAIAARTARSSRATAY